SSQPQQQDPNQLPKRTYLMEDALAGLNSQKAQLAFLVIGGKTGVNYYLGMSLPPDSLGEDVDPAKVSYNTLKSIIHSVYNGADIYQESFDSEKIRSMISPLSENVGIVTGIPALKSAGGDTMDSEQIERLANGLQGHEFGMLTLAVPIPSAYVSRE